MLDKHLYLLLTPEALTMSMLAPAEFGAYLATGTQKRISGEAIYFDLKPDFASEYFDLVKGSEKCVPHKDGSPKRTVYLNIYRVLEHIPLSALNQLHLTTRDGRVLSLDQAELPSTFNDKYYLYDELCPVNPMIASKLPPGEFCKYITNKENSLYIPRIVFSQLNPDKFIPEEDGENIYHPHHYLPETVKFCFNELDSTNKITKTVARLCVLNSVWRHVKNGYYIGDKDGVIYYPLPSVDELDSKHHDWWRSVNT